MASRISELWMRIVDWLHRNAPETYSSLHPPADNAALDQLAVELGMDLPGALVESLRCFNGTNTRRLDVAFAFPGTFYALGTADIADEARVEKDVLGDGAEGLGRLWHPAWIPIAADYGGDLLVLDTRDRRPFGDVFCSGMRSRVDRSVSTRP